jgi:hypothetical protein
VGPFIRSADIPGVYDKDFFPRGKGILAFLP